MPTARHSLTLGRSSSTGHSLPGARPLDPLVHMFHPSAGTHVLSFGTALTDAWLCLGAGAMPPALVLMFNPSYGTHLSSYGTVLTDAQLCLGISISPISIQLHIFTGPI